MHIRRWLAVATVLGFACTLCFRPVEAGGGTGGTKYAFLVGCSKYLKTEFRELPTPVHDIEGFRKALLATGFDKDNIIVLHDDMKERRYIPEKAKVLRELELLLDGMKAQDTIVVALSGHGLHYKGDATGYFVPVDGKVGDKNTLIAMDGEGGLFAHLKACKAKRKLFIVNACRNDPTVDPSFAGKKYQVDSEDGDVVPEGIAAIYSCKIGKKSYYEPGRKQSIFFDHVTRAWQGEYQKEGKVTLEAFFEQVTAKTKIDVNRTLEVSQVPEVRREYKGEWVVNERPVLVAKPAKNLKAGDVITNSIGMKFVWIPPGNFVMGSPRDEKERSDNETQHKVTLSRGYYMGMYTVTQEQWQEVMGDNPSHFKGQKNLPVERVSWDDCQEFIKKLREKDKKLYRLPTEAEWEYSCRAGTKTPFHFGETISTDQANYDGNFIYGDGKKGVYREKTTPVGSFPANAWGLHDMHGNVFQWCQDWLGDYPQQDAVDPTGPNDGKFRVLRGGSWYNIPEYCRSAFRSRTGPGSRYDIVGCRLCFCLD